MCWRPGQPLFPMPVRFKDLGVNCLQALEPLPCPRIAAAASLAQFRT